MTTSGKPSQADREILDGEQVESEGLADWRLLFDTLHARFTTPDFATALALVGEIGAEAERVDHHPDLDLGWGRVRVRLSSHDVGGVTARDVRLARAISEAAARHGATAVPAEVSVLEIALDTPDADEIAPFWAAVLGYTPATEFAEVVDPRGVHPTVWFQRSEPDQEVPAQRFHLDLRVPPEIAEERVRAAVEAGGTLVSDERAPAYWVLADAQGNRACVTTWQGREH